MEKSIGRHAAFKAALIGFVGGMGSTRTVQQQGTFNGNVQGTDANGAPVNSTVSGTYQNTQVVTDPEAAARVPLGANR